MEDKLLNILEKNGVVFLTELPKLMPEIKGEFAIFMPVNKGFNPNILLLHGVTQEFIKVFNKLLVDDKIIEWKREDVFTLMFHGVPIYAGISMATPRRIRTKKECWLPVSIKLKAKATKQ